MAGFGSMSNWRIPRNSGYRGFRIGMLFDFKAPRVIVMWMKDTLIPLDMLFIAADGTIVTIAENTRPLSLAAISSRVPVLGVLEVNAGTVRRLGLRAGDRVVHPIFGG